MWRGNWRDEYWSDLGQPWDVIIVGGGIVGAGIFRECSRMGWRALLVEQRDFGWGTSSRSSKFVHGGLRYLKQLQFGLTWESVHERQRLLKEGRGLIEPIGFLIARYEGEKTSKLTYQVALSIYDLIGGKRNHRHYDAEQFKMLAPQMREAGLLYGFSYADAQTDDARLTLRVIKEALEAGGAAINYVRVESLLRNSEQQVVGVRLHDIIGDRSAEAHARVVVNATGVWADRLPSQIGLKPIIRPLRGSHLVFASWRFPVAQAININHPIDDRPISIFPWEGVTIVGSTDTDQVGSLDDEPSITPEEVAYLMAVVEKAFPTLRLTLDDVIASFAGVRPVIDTGEEDPAKESREHQANYDKGLLTVTGGKLTTFHRMAFDALRKIPPELLSTSVQQDSPALDPIEVEMNLAEPKRSRLLGRYGNDASALLAAAKEGELETIGGTPALWAELRWAARAEAVMHLDDLLLRRVRLGILLPQGAKSLLSQIRVICQPELGWSDERWEAEEASYLALWKRCYSLPDRGLIPDWRTPMIESAAQQGSSSTLHRVLLSAVAMVVVGGATRLLRRKRAAIKEK